MTYRQRPVEVEAEQRQAAGTVWNILLETALPYRAGDWIVTGVCGERWVVPQAVFQTLYERMDAAPAP